MHFSRASLRLETKSCNQWVDRRRVEVRNVSFVAYTCTYVVVDEKRVTRCGLVGVECGKLLPYGEWLTKRDEPRLGDKSGRVKVPKIDVILSEGVSDRRWTTSTPAMLHSL